MTTTDPTAPATPGDALRWAAERMAEKGFAMRGGLVFDMLRRWADELDAARATDPAPATPPEHQRVDSELYAVLVPASTSPFVDFCADATEAAEVAAELAAREHPGFRAYRLVPLSSTPPAGTEG